MCEATPVDVDDALSVLGLDRAADWPSVRAAYRRRIQAVHPDRAEGDAAQALRANAALAALEPVYRPRSAERPASSPPPPPPTAPAPATAVVRDHEITLDAPPDELFDRLVDALTDLGDIVSVDLRAGVVEALVLDGAGHLTITLHDATGSGADVAEFVLASRWGGPLPPIETLVRMLAERVRETP